MALSEFLHLSYVSDEMGWSIDLPLEIRVDNAAAVAFSGGNTRRSKLRHIDMRQQWVAQLRDAGVCKLAKVDTKANLADPFTKMFTGDEHATTKKWLFSTSAIRDIHQPPFGMSSDIGLEQQRRNQKSQG